MTTPYVDPQTIHNPSTGASPPASWGDAVRDALEGAGIHITPFVTAAT